jgi:hypothetical protein
MNQFNINQHFEVHVTIEKTSKIDPFITICNNFTNYAKNLGLHVTTCKPILIELSEGENYQQPMCSIFCKTTIQGAIHVGQVFGKYCETNYPDYKVCRNKVEARFENVINNLDITPFNNNAIYWEFHIKIIFNDDSKINDFRTMIQFEYPKAHLSKSALSKDLHSRIITLRLYKGDKDNAAIEINDLIYYLNNPDIREAFGYRIRLTVEKELSIYDTNVSHDIGWINLN